MLDHCVNKLNLNLLNLVTTLLIITHEARHSISTLASSLPATSSS